MTNIKVGKMIKINRGDEGANMIANRSVILPSSQSHNHINPRIRNTSNRNIIFGNNQGIGSQIRILESSVNNIDYVADKALSALGQQTGFSLIRLGDSEILVLAQNVVFPTSIDVNRWADLMAKLCSDPILGKGDNEVGNWNFILQASGVNYPDTNAQDLLIQGIRMATMVGVPVGYRPGRSWQHLKLLQGFQTVLLNALPKLKLSLDSMNLTDSAAHFFLYASGWFYKILFLDRYPDLCQRYSLPIGFKPRILLVGLLAPEVKNLLTAAGCNIIGAIQSVGITNVWQTIDQIQGFSFDIALVSAGTAAKYICPHISSHMHKVALDTGQLFDLIIGNNGNLEYSQFTIPFDWIL